MFLRLLKEWEFAVCTTHCNMVAWRVHSSWYHESDICSSSLYWNWYQPKRTWALFWRNTRSEWTPHLVKYGQTKQRQRVLRKRVGCQHVDLHLLREVYLLFSYVPKCLLPFWCTPFNRQSSKSCFNYEPCLFLCANPIRTNKRVFSAIMGLSIGWQPRTEILCIFVYIYLYIYMRVYGSVCFCCECR